MEIDVVRTVNIMDMSERQAKIVRACLELAADAFTRMDEARPEDVTVNDLVRVFGDRGIPASYNTHGEIEAIRRDLDSAFNRMEIT